MDARQAKVGRSDYSKRLSSTLEKVFGTFSFYKMNLITKKTEEVKEGKAALEISTARVVESVRMSKKRRAHFEQSYFTSARRDVEWFNAIDELKKGIRIFTPTAVYWAEYAKPAQAELSLKAAA